jgi:hypothetical protein
VRMHSPHAIDGIPGGGIDYGLLRYLRSDTAERLRTHREPQLLLNYLGHMHFGGSGDELRLDRDLLANVSTLPEPGVAVRHELTIIAGMLGDDLAVTDVTPKLFLPGLSGLTQGIPHLSCLGVLSDRILGADFTATERPIRRSDEHQPIR